MLRRDGLPHIVASKPSSRGQTIIFSRLYATSREHPGRIEIVTRRALEAAGGF